MGFMAGFGPAFNRSMELRREAENNKKDDLFKMRFAETLDQKEKFEAREREVAKNTKLAKALLQSTGTNPSALPTVFNWIDSGMSPEAIQKNLMTGKITVNEKSPVDQQMQASGMTSGGPPVAPEPAPTASGNTELLQNNPKNPATKFKLPGMFNRTERINRDVDQRLTEATGMSPEQIAGMKPNYDPMDESGITFTPAPPEREPNPINSLEESGVELALAQAEYEADPSEANQKRLAQAETIDNALKSVATFEEMVKNGGSTGGPGGTWVAVIDPKTEVASYTWATQTPSGWIDTKTNEPITNRVKVITPELGKAMRELGTGQTNIQPYIERSAALTSLFRDAKQVNDIVTANPAVLAQGVSSIAETIQMVGTELQAVEEIFQKEGVTAGDAALNNLEKTLESGSINDLATASKLLGVKRIKMAMSLARMNGDSGKSMSDADVERYLGQIPVHGDPVKFRAAMAQALIGSMKELEQIGQNMNKHNGEMGAFYSSNGFYMKPLVPDVKSQIIGPDADPEVSAGYELLAKSYDGGLGTVSGTGKAEVNSNSNAVKISRKNMEILLSNPSEEAKKMFDDAYNQPGLADKILEEERKKQPPSGEANKPIRG